MREQTMDRLIRLGLKAVAVGVVAAVAIYFLERGDGTPTLVQRQITAAEAAVRAAPTEIGLRLRLADMYRASKRWDDALSQYDAVLGVEKNQSTAMLGRGEVLAQTKDLPGADKAFEAVIANAKEAEYAGVNPQLEAAYYGLASVKLKQKEAKEAAKAAREAIKIEPTDADALYLLGTAELRAGSYEQAIKALRKVVLFVPIEWCNPYEEMASAYRAQHRKPFAEYASAMVELCEKDAAGAAQRLKPVAKGSVAVDAMLGLGMAAEAQNQRANATRWYRKVIARQPENFNAQTGLARLGVIGPASDVPKPHPVMGGE